jgi:hypothetical protein
MGYDSRRIKGGGETRKSRDEKAIKNIKIDSTGRIVRYQGEDSTVPRYKEYIRKWFLRRYSY